MTSTLIVEVYDSWASMWREGRPSFQTLIPAQTGEHTTLIGKIVLDKYSETSRLFTIEGIWFSQPKLFNLMAEYDLALQPLPSGIIVVIWKKQEGEELSLDLPIRQRLKLARERRHSLGTWLQDGKNAI